MHTHSDAFSNSTDLFDPEASCGWRAQLGVILIRQQQRVTAAHAHGMAWGAYTVQMSWPRSVVASNEDLRAFCRHYGPVRRQRSTVLASATPSYRAGRGVLGHEGTEPLYYRLLLCHDPSPQADGIVMPYSACAHSGGQCRQHPRQWRRHASCAGAGSRQVCAAKPVAMLRYLRKVPLLQGAG